MDINFANNPDVWIRVTAAMAREERAAVTVDNEKDARRKIQQQMQLLEENGAASFLTGANSTPITSVGPSTSKDSASWRGQSRSSDAME